MAELKAKSKQIPQWFKSVIASGLQQLMPLGLPGTPAADTIKLTSTAWAQSLWSSNIGWDKAQDAQRLLHAFIVTGGRAERWPPPRAVLAVMQPRERSLEPSAAPIDRRKSEKLRAVVLNLVNSFK